MPAPKTVCAAVLMEKTIYTCFCTDVIHEGQLKDQGKKVILGAADTFRVYSGKTGRSLIQKRKRARCNAKVFQTAYINVGWAIPTLKPVSRYECRVRRAYRCRAVYQ